MLLPVLALLVPPVAAHVAPSPTENNRYTKVTLLAASVRLSYTVYFGDQPGALERRRIDRNGDGRLDEAEARAFGSALAAEIGPALDVTLDEQRAAVPWLLTDVGLGTPTVAAGAFSMDMALAIPVAGVGEHTLWLDDRWPVPQPGETQVRVESAPGVRILESHVRRNGRGALLDFTFRGAAAAGGRGILVRYAVDAAALPPPTATPTRRGPLWIAVAVAALLAIGARAWRASARGTDT